MAAFAGHRPPHHASTFPDHDAAESALRDLLAPRQRQLDEWLAGDLARMCIAADLGRPVGRVANAFGQIWDSSWLRVVLTRDPAAPDGWWLLTGYPTPAPSGEPVTALATPALAHLVGAYFHQDWYDDLGECDRVGATFATDSPTLAPKLPGEVMRLLEDVDDDLDLQVHLIDLGWEFRAYAEEGGAAAWLRHVAGLIA